MNPRFRRETIGCFFLSAALLAAPARGEDAPDLETKADAIRATAAELRFLEIPWLTDVSDAFLAATKEKRPIFLYLVTGDPLDDC